MRSSKTSGAAAASQTAIQASTKTIEGVAFDVADGEPRARDLDIAVKLGYERPRKIRDLIERWAPEIGPALSRPTVGRGLFRGKTQESVTVTEFWLTEEQALFIAAKSDTETATAVLKEIIRVFVLARKGLLPAVPVLDLAAIRDAVRAELASEISVIGARLAAIEGRATTAAANTSPLIGEGYAQTFVLSTIGDVARLRARAIKNDTPSTVKRLRVITENELRNIVGFHRGKGKGWYALPSSQLGEAMDALHTMRESARSMLAVSAPQPVQLSLVPRRTG